MRSTVTLVDSIGDMISMSKPSVSWSPKYLLTKSMRLRSCARSESSQKMVFMPDRRARLTASLTQSWIGASLVWHARQMSFASTLWEIRTSPAELTTWTSPSAGLLRSEEHTSELQSRFELVCRLLLAQQDGDVQRHAAPP